MVVAVYWGLLGVYALLFTIALFYYLFRRAPGGDAAVGWAIGIFYTAGLAGVTGIAWLLRGRPAIGLFVLAIPPVFLALPRLRRVGVALYTRLPVFPEPPLLTLIIENQSVSRMHVRLECWLGSAKSHQSRLYSTLHYYVEPLEKSSFPLTGFQTRLLAHRSRFVSVSCCEQVPEAHEEHAYFREIQPARQYVQEPPEAFRSGQYRLVIAGP